jgi:hypothetical protein
MASWKPEIYDGDEVIAYYENSDAVTFRCFAGTKPDPAYLRYAFEETDMGMKAEGVEQLRGAVAKILSNKKNTNPYLLEVVHKAKGKGHKAVTTNITFQLNEIPSFGSMQQFQGGSDPALLQVLKGIGETNNLILSKLNAEEEEEPGALTGMPKNPLIGMIERPEIQNVLASALGEFLKKTFKLNSNAPSNDHLLMSGLNGVNMQDEKIQQAVQILKKHDPEIGDTLLKLAQLAENNPDYFKNLLMMLKQM